VALGPISLRRTKIGAREMLAAPNSRTKTARRDKDV